MNKYFAVGAVCLFMGLLIGYIWGYKDGVEWTVKTGLEFLQAQGVDIGIDSVKLSDILQYYQSKVNNYVAQL